MTAEKRTRFRFERKWRFFKGNLKNAKAVSFDDSKWRRLDLPHDWSIESPFDEKNPSGQGGGYLPGGYAWYRKTFTLPAKHNGKRVVVEFDGVYMNSTVWINGHKLGTHAYGYTSFQFDLTPYLKFGKEKNVLAVHVDNSKQPNTRWYSGSGIYRHVWLTITDKIHIMPWGIAISTVKATKSSATVRIETEVANDAASAAEVQLETRIVGPGRKTVGVIESTQEIATAGKIVQKIVVKRPLLWGVDSPVLYQAVTRIQVGSKVVDDLVTSFGIRTFCFNPHRGFMLNGRKLKLKGVNLHHDNGCLGAVVYDRAEERRVGLMKSIGANAIRTSHNPPSPEFIDACDRLGIVVMEEAFDEWEIGKLKYGYKDYFKDCWRKDLTSMVRRDRNHPSIVLWSIGNEVPEQAKLKGARTAGKLARFIRKIDPTRPVGYGAYSQAWTPQLWEALDVCGYNYRDDLYGSDHKKYPKRCILGSETFALYAFDTWTRAVENKHIIGEFIWTGMDYIGESGIGYAQEAYTKYPVNTACCGELDLCGFKKPRSYFRDILWDNGTELFIAVRQRLADGEAFKISHWGWPAAKSSWTWPDAASKDVHVDVYSTCEEVELRLNGRTIGKNTTSRASRYLASWVIQYEPGILEAIGYRGGKKVVTQILRTAGDPAKIRLTTDRQSIIADGYDLAFVTVDVLDNKGVFHPNADNEIRFSVNGPGQIVGVGNGDQRSIESFQAKKRKAYNGHCLVVIRSSTRADRIELTAQSPGLKSAQSIITAR